MKKLQIRTLANRTGGFTRDIGSDDPSGTPCVIRDCTTTCLFRVECCCFYDCPSGGTWVCRYGYCSSTSYSCL